MTPAQKSFWASIFLAGVELLAGCDATLTPFADDTGLYSVYGYLTLSSGPHFLRVTNLNVPVTSDSTRTLDATVTLKNLATGQTETLTDSIVVFGEIYTHNFRTDQNIQPGVTYRLRIEQPDGQVTRAIATMPRNTKVEVTPPSSDSVGCDEGINLHFSDIRGESQIQVSGGVVWDDSLRWTRGEFKTPKGDSVETTGGYLPWEIVEDVVPKPVLAPIPDSTEYCKVLEEKKVHVAYTHFGPDWPADSVFRDPAQSTVKNGLGVFGGLRSDTLTLLLKPID